MTPNQKRGEHGEVATKIVNGVRVNDVAAEAKAEKAAAAEAAVDYSEFTKAELHLELDKRGIEYSASANKDELFALLK